MSEIKLDAETGLPEIRGDHWWEVRKFKQRRFLPYGFEPVYTEDGYEVCLVTKVTVPPKVTPGRHWWEPAKHTPGYVKDKVVLRKQITDPELYRQPWREYRKVGKALIEPADVLKTAKDIIDMAHQISDRAAREEISEGLLGVYPPNALASGGAK